jgi:hypothetical protein
MNRPLAVPLALLLALGGPFAIHSHAAAAPPAGLAVPVDGQPFQSSLSKVEAGWKIAFAAHDRELPAADLVSWGAFAEATRGPQLLLAGGGVLVADVLEINKEHLRADAVVAGTFQLPLESVAGVLLRPPVDPRRRDQLIAKVLAVAGDSDRLLLDNGDELAGTVAAVHGETLTLESAAGKIELELAKVLAIVFNPALREKTKSPGLRCWVGFSDGSRVLATSLTMNPATAQLKLAGGESLQASSNTIVALLPLGGRAVYLSDLKAAGYRHVPYLELPWPYRRDESVTGGLLRSGGKVFLKGLGMHSASRLTYDLPRAFHRFQAEVAIDDETHGGGSVVVRVFTDDGSGKWQPKFTSPTIRGNDPPVPISIDLSGAKRISLLIDFADHGDELDHADWLNARLVK